MIKNHSFIFAAASLAMLAGADTAFSQGFGIGDIAVLRVGDGTQTIANTGNSIFIDDYTTAGVLSHSYAIPNSGASSLISSGTATSEGALSRSADGRSLFFAGYNTTLPFATSLPASTSTTVPRGFGSVNASGTYVFGGSTTTQFSANNIRSAVSDGQNNIWLAGATGGTYYFGNNGAAATVQSSIANTRVLNIENGNLYFSTGSGTRGIYGFAGAPTTTTAPTLLIGTGGSSSPYDFAINDTGTIAYVADDRPYNATTPNSGGGVERWELVAGVWNLIYTLRPEATGTGGARSLAVDFSGASPVLYGDTSETTGNQVFSLTDTGSGSVANTLATAPSTEAFRGVDVAPVPEPGTWAIMGCGALGMLFFRRKK